MVTDKTLELRMVLFLRERHNRGTVGTVVLPLVLPLLTGDTLVVRCSPA